MFFIKFKGGLYLEDLLKRLPLPICGLMLAFAAAGNLLQSYGSLYRNIFGFMSAIILVLFLAKIIKHPSLVKEDLKNPLVASVLPTLTMGMMLLSTYVKPFAPSSGFAMWIISLLGHMVLVVKFTINYIFKLELKNVFPSWFIVYVGIVVGSVTGPVFGMEVLGRILFWLGLISYFILLPLVIKRIRLRNIPEPALPTLAIFAAPLALCLAGYMNSFESKNMIIVWSLLVLSQISYVFVLLQLPKLLKLSFYPSFSGFTFPLVISATSIKLLNGFLTNSGDHIQMLGYMVRFEEIVAILILIYVLFKYTLFLSKSQRDKSLGPQTNRV